MLTFTLVTTSVGLSSDVLRMFSKKVFVSSGVMSSLLGKECNKAVLERKLLICSKKCMRTAPGRGDGFEGVEYGVVQLEKEFNYGKFPHLTTPVTTQSPSTTFHSKMFFGAYLLNAGRLLE